MHTVIQANSNTKSIIVYKYVVSRLLYILLYTYTHYTCTVYKVIYNTTRVLYTYIYSYHYHYHIHIALT